MYSSSSKKIDCDNVMKRAVEAPRPRQAGVDNWVSSDIHAKTEVAKNAQEQKKLYGQWASSYDEEMNAHCLASYKSVTTKAIALLSARPAGPLAVIDAGCGTGLLGKHFRDVVLASDAVAVEESDLTLTGTDLSPDMLSVAAKKKCFDRLEPSDMKQRLPFPDQSFDLVVSSGVFLPGHCGPESVCNMLAVLKPGGHAVFTVREAFFRDANAEFRRAIAASGCELLEAELMPYYGEIQANVVVVQKSSAKRPVAWSKVGGDLREAYEAKGWAELDTAVSSTEIDAIQAYVAQRKRDDHPGNIFDADDQLRAVHGYDVGFAPDLMTRLAQLAKAFIGCKQVYVYQFRVNSKQPTTGNSGTWQPHRDFDFWQGMDGMPSPRALVCHVLLNAHHDANGPVIFCDGSHKAEVEPVVAAEEGWKTGFNEEGFKYSIAADEVEAWQDKSTLMGPAGTVAIMHPKMWHFSGPNRSDAARMLLSVVFNDLDNINVQPAGTEARPEFVVQKPSLVF